MVYLYIAMCKNISKLYKLYFYFAIGNWPLLYITYHEIMRSMGNPNGYKNEEMYVLE